MEKKGKRREIILPLMLIVYAVVVAKYRYPAYRMSDNLSELFTIVGCSIACAIAL